MRRLFGSMVVLVALVLPQGAFAKGSDVNVILDTLRHGSVYASSAANPTLTSAEVRRVRSEIARRDPGRIRIAVVSDAQANSAGSVTALANTLQRRLNAPGTVLVKGGSRVWLAIAYPDTSAATSAVQQAFDAHDKLADKLVDAVNGIASIDPRTEPQAPGSSPRSAPVDTSQPATFDVPWLLIVALVGLPLLGFLLVGGGRRWQAGRAARETFDDDLADARQELVALGDDVTELDLADSMPDADPAGKRDYEAAVVQYQRAERLLGEKANVRRLARANAAIAEGRRLMDSARVRLDGTRGTATAPPPQQPARGPT